MTTFPSLVTAATVAALIGSLSARAQLPVVPPYPQTPIPGTPAGNPPERTNTPADPKTAREVVLAALSQLVNAALTEGQFRELIAQCAQQHRIRLGDLAREDETALNKAIAQFRVEYQSRYHQPFAFTADVLNTADITLGPTRKVAMVMLVQPQFCALVLNPLRVPGLDDPLDRHEPVIMNGPLVTLTNEGSEREPLWKLDIPSDISGRQFKDNLTRHIQDLTDRRSTWSDDASITQQMAAREVLQAMWDKALAKGD